MSKTSHALCTTVTSQNEECRNEFIHTNWQITMRECAELNSGFSALEMMAASKLKCKVENTGVHQEQ